MTIQSYLIIENNVVTNNVLWDGNPETWQPPIDSVQVIDATTPALIWMLNAEKTDWVLNEQMGAGDIGFTWNGSVLTTYEPKPEPPKPQPVTDGLQTL